MTERVYRVVILFRQFHSLAYLLDAAIGIRIEAVRCPHTLVEVEQVFIFRCVDILVEQGLNDCRHTHFHICAVRAALACLSTLVTNDAVLIVFLPQIIQVHSVDTCKA